MKFTSQIKQLTFDELKSSLDNLPKSNRWVKLGDELPWDEIEKIYNARLNNDKKGAGNKPARLVIGALIIKHKMNLSDEDTINIIQENPYMQYMLGLSEFTSKPVFEPSLFVTIRKRLQVEDFNRFTESLMKCKRTDSQDDADADNNDDETTHGGTLKVDATYSDAEVRYPTDLDILHDGCKAVERIIDRFCKLADIQRPDTHMKKIHKRYAKTVKKKVKPNKDLKECRRYLIAHLSRNIRTCLDLMAHHSTDSFNALNELDKRLLFITIKMLEQQKWMSDNNVHSCKDRIISIFQPHVRPIVRGKAKTRVEFGAKIGVAIVNGFTFIDHHSWDAYNESEDMKTHIEAFKRRFGMLPARVEADKIYLNRLNRKYLKDNNIECCSKPLGRPPKEGRTEDYEEKMARYSGERNEIEATFGTGNDGAVKGEPQAMLEGYPKSQQRKTKSERVYRANNIRGKLADTGAAWTAACYFAKNVMKFLRNLLHALFLLLDFRSILSTKRLSYENYAILA